MQKTKKFTFGVVYQAYGDVTIDVPADLDLEDAKEYVKDNWGGMPLPDGEYILDSDEPDFSDAKFEDDEDDEDDEED